MIKSLNFGIAICAALFFFACTDNLDFSNHDVGQEIETPAMNTETFVSLQQATDVAEAFFGIQSTLKSAGPHLKSVDPQKKVMSTKTITDGKNKNPLMYVMNYSDGGWVIVSSTKNYYPVLAYSSESSFELTEDMGPVTIWLDETKEAIRTSDALDDSIKLAVRLEWSKYAPVQSRISPKPMLKSFANNYPWDAMSNRMCELYYQYGPDGWYKFYSLQDAQYYLDNSSIWNYLMDLAYYYGSPPEYTIVGIKEVPYNVRVGPLLTSQWGQGYPFDTQVCCPSGVPAGCGAVAIAQIMKYHRPTGGLSLTHNGHTIDWNNLPDFHYAVQNTSVPYLIAAARMASNTSYCGWPVNASWAWPGDVADALRFYGYTVSRQSHDLREVSSQLQRNRPFIMLGFPGALNPDGHYWICDGINYSETTVYYFIEFLRGGPGDYDYSGMGITSPVYPGGGYTYGSCHYHLNWGWSGSCDGWYASPCHPDGKPNYNSYRENFYITP